MNHTFSSSVFLKTNKNNLMSKLLDVSIDQLAVEGKVLITLHLSTAWGGVKFEIEFETAHSLHWLQEWSTAE